MKGLFGIVTAIVVAAWSASATAKPQVLGWVEWALVSDGQVRFKAKLDTGAKSLRSMPRT